MQYNKQSIIMDQLAMQRALSRIAHEIIEKNKGVNDICLVGVKRRGVSLAKYIQKLIFIYEKVELPLGEIDIKWYRDDLVSNGIEPKVRSYNFPFSVKNKTVIIVDDVIFTGRTSRAAIDLIMDNARPQRIQLAVLIDRGHRELPIKPDFVGKNVPTNKNEIVKVHVPEYDSSFKVVLYSD